jgi:hypothetical protein
MASSCIAASVRAASSNASSCADSCVESFKIDAASLAALMAFAALDALTALATFSEYGASLDTSLPAAKMTNACVTKLTCISQELREAWKGTIGK